ncbi:MAG: hypothetical protein HY722_06465 [Planctomycetes bacterium]|nr:hypothetical protein [Planctomycetota bacterium]
MARRSYGTAWRRGRGALLALVALLPAAPLACRLSPSRAVPDEPPAASPAPRAHYLPWRRPGSGPNPADLVLEDFRPSSRDLEVLRPGSGGAADGSPSR